MNETITVNGNYLNIIEDEAPLSYIFKGDRYTNIRLKLSQSIYIILILILWSTRTAQWLWVLGH